MSVSDMRALSIQPPTYPLTSPSATPMTVEITVARKPTRSEARMAYKRRLNTSRPT